MEINILDPFANIFEKISSGEITFSVDGIVKYIAIGLLLFYLFYALLIVRQVTLMNDFLETKLSSWTKIASVIFLLYTFFVLVAVILY